MKFLFLLLALLAFSPAHATVTTDQQYILNHMNGAAAKVGLGDRLADKVLESQLSVPNVSGGLYALRVARFTYDFAVDGGAIGTITLAKTVTLPAGSVMLYSVVDVPTAVTSAGSATVALTCSAAGDILPATAKASLSLAALIVGTEDWTAANMKRNASACTVKAVVATAAVTAGKIVGHVVYAISP